MTMCSIMLSHTFGILVLCFTTSALDLLGLAHDDPNLIKVIKEEMIEDYDPLKPYNFTENASYTGQYNQAVEVAELLGNKRNGLFIEAGAFDGEAFSNTLLFEVRYNWTGLLVEPNPDLYDELRTKQRRTKSIKTCFATENNVHEVDFDAAGAYGGIINGRNKPGDAPVEAEEFIRKQDPNRKRRFPFERKTMKMQCVPFMSIIMAMGNPVIDYLSLDIEGAEFPVLKTIDFQKVDIKVISFEYDKLESIFEGSSTSLRYFMKRNGYKHYKNVHIDSIYVKKDLLEQLNKDEL